MTNETEQTALKLLNEGMVLSEVEKKVNYKLIAFKDVFNDKYIRVNLWKELKELKE